MAKVRTEITDGVGVITLADPTTLSAATVDIMQALRGAFETLTYGSEARAILITGEGRGFCSGANFDLLEQATKAAGGPEVKNLHWYAFSAITFAVRPSP